MPDFVLSPGDCVTMTMSSSMKTGIVMLTCCSFP